MIQIAVINKEEDDLNRIITLLSGHEDFKIIGLGRSGFDAIKLADNLHPDIIVIEQWMGDINGAELAPIIIRKSPETKLIAIGSRNDSAWIMQALGAGISGCLIKQFHKDELANAVRTVYYGGYYIDRPLIGRLCNHFFITDTLFKQKPGHKTYSTEITILPDISETGLNIISYIAKGYSDKEIAEELCIAPGTVRNCLAVIKRKTGQKNRAQLVIHFLRHGQIAGPWDPDRLLETHNSRQRHI